MNFFKSKFNITMLIIFGVGLALLCLTSLVDIFMPIGLDLIAIAMLMEANNVYNANKERKDMDEVDGIKESFDARNISVDEDFYYVPEENKKLIFKQKVRKYNDTMSFCILLTVFAFVIIGITIGFYIGLI